MPESTDPDLTLRVTQETLADGRKALRYLANARERRRGLYYTTFDSRPFEVDPHQHFQQLFGDIALIPRDRSHGWLEGRGAILCRDLVPEQLRRELWALLDSVRTVQILSDDLWIPWELLWLRNPDNLSLPGRFLVEAFSVTRWPLGSEPILALPMRNIALVIPRDAGLPTSTAEGRRLGELSGASRKVMEIPATLGEVMQAMAGGTYEGWHFAGHGVASADSPHRWCIVLEQHEELHPPHLYSLAGQFGRTHPLVFLNACSSGRGAASLSGAAGLATAFLEAGAGAFLGSHWELEDEHAFCFAEELYTQLFSGQEIGEAVRIARAKLRRDFPDTSDWLAYTVFAHPLARCAPAVEQRDEPEQPTRPERKRPARRPKPPRADGVAPPAQKTTAGATRGDPVEVVEPLPPPPEPPMPVGPAPGAELINEKDGTVLLYVPGGEIALGAEGVHPWSRPVRRVRLSPFWIGKHPITNEQYARFLDENPEATVTPPAFWEDPRFNQPRQPVVGVSWEEARAYCRWAGLELPTEAQWEAAARGTDRRPYPWGKETPTPRHASFNGTGGGPTPVDAHPAGAGPYGTLDQAGNVWEWCADPWASNLYQQIQGDQIDPIAKGDGAVRALRGGSWMNPAKDLHAAYRDRGTAKLRFNTQGFRCVRRPT